MMDVMSQIGDRKRLGTELLIKYNISSQSDCLLKKKSRSSWEDVIINCFILFQYKIVEKVVRGWDRAWDWKYNWPLEENYQWYDPN